MSSLMDTARFIVSVQDILGRGNITPTEVLSMELPLINAMIKAKVELEQKKAEARKKAEDMEKMKAQNKRGMHR